jgi:hypothetical protein
MVLKAAGESLAVLATSFGVSRLAIQYAARQEKTTWQLPNEGVSE